MAIVKMKRITLIAEKEKKDSLLHDLMWLGSLDVSYPFDNPDEIPEYLTADSDTEGKKWAEMTDRIHDAIDVLSPYHKGTKGLFSKPYVLTRESFESFEKDNTELLGKVKRTLQVRDELHSLKSSENKLETKLNFLSAWESVKVNVNAPFSKYADLILGTIPQNAVTEEQIKTALDETGCHYEFLKKTSEQFYLAVVCLKSDVPDVLTALSSIRFTKANFKDLTTSVNEEISLIKNRLKGISERRATLEKELEESAKYTDELEKAYDIATSISGLYETKEMLLTTKTVFLMSGWCPVTKLEKLESCIKKYECYYEAEDPKEDEEPPVLLKNNWFARQFEGITEMYSLPAYRGIDPNFTMSPFYFIFFGLMIGDLGYGGIITLFCLLALIFCHFGDKMKQMLTMFTLCGVSSMFWGFMFGSCFGDVIQVFSREFMGHEVPFNPLWFNPVEDPMSLLIFSFLLGFVHIMVGLGVKFFMLCRDGHPFVAFFDAGFWMILLLGIPVWVSPMVLPFIPAVVGKVGLGMVIGGAVGLVLTQGRNSKNIFGKFFGGVYSLYDITSYMSDILSYSRILALGLASGVIGQVFNIIATSFGGGVIGFIVFLIVFILGTVINTALSTLSAYVHASRLQFIEFFGKFYESGGREFNPLRPRCKNSEIKY